MKLFITTICLLAGLQLNAQGSMFWNDYAMLNPSLSGFKFKHQGYLSYKDEASSLVKNLVANYSGKIEKYNLGLGINYTGYELASTVGNNLFANSSYGFKAGDNKFITIGAAGGLVSQRFNYEYYTDSANIASELYKVKQFVLDLGLSYISEKLMMGISAQNVNEPSYMTKDSLLNFIEERRYLGLFEYRINLLKKLQFIPRVMFQSNFDNLNSLTVNGQLSYDEKYMFAFGYNTDKLYTFNINWDVKGKFRAGYSFEIRDNEFSYDTYNHEAVVGLLIQEGKKKKKGLLK